MALRLGVLFCLYAALRYVLVPPNPDLVGGGWITVAVMDVGFPLTLFPMVYGVVLAVMYPAWRRRREQLPGLSQAFNMAITPMAILCVLFIVSEIMNPLWR